MRRSKDRMRHLRPTWCGVVQTAMPGRERQYCTRPLALLAGIVDARNFDHQGGGQRCRYRLTWPTGDSLVPRSIQITGEFRRVPGHPSVGSEWARKSPKTVQAPNDP